MKIIFCTNAFENITNGPAKFAHLILEINQRYPEHQLRVVTEDIGEETPLVYKVPLAIPRLLKPLGQFLRMFIYYRKLKSIRNEFAYDVIVYNNAFTGLWASWISPVPTVGMINDEKNIRATLSNVGINRWWLKQFLFKQLEKLSTRTHKAIITNSDFLRNRVINAYHVPAAKVHRLYKSIDLTAISHQPARTFHDPIRILFVKADYRVGNLSVLAEALAKLPEHAFALTVIGPEPQFEAEVRGFFIQKDTILLNYLGPQPQSVVYGYLRTNDIFCVPSNSEALGVANIEALAHGIPVISTRVGGIPEVLNQGENGWLVSPNDALALAEAIRECISDAPLRHRKSEQGKLFITRFSKDVMIDEFVKIVDRVCM